MLFEFCRRNKDNYKAGPPFRRFSLIFDLSDNISGHQYLPIRMRNQCHKESALPDWQESLYGPPVRKRRRPRCVVLCCFLISGNAESCLAQEDGGAAGHIVLQLHGEGGELTADRVVGTLLFKQSDV